jgi:putative ABC transport system permease protein
MRYAIRSLRRTPGYSFVAIVALALGIGANAAIFGAVDTVLLRSLPYPHADRLVVPVSENAARDIEHASISFADYEDWKRETDVFDHVALWRPINVDVTGTGDPERIVAGQVSEEFFPLVDAKLVAGRPFAPSDHGESAQRVTVLSFNLWQRRFGGDLNALGKTLRVAGIPHDIVGILADRAAWPEEAELFLPFRPMALGVDERTRRDNLIFLALARLRDAVPIEQGNARLAAIAARLEAEHPESRKGWTNRLIPLREYVVEADVRRALLVLLAAVGAVLLIACANLASLALVRAAGRSRDMAIRFALGASRARVVLQMAAESVVVAAGGTVAGLGLAVWMMRGIAAMAPEGTPFIDRLGLDARVAAAAAVFGALAVVIAGIIPALASSGIQLTPALKDGTASSGSSRKTNLLRQGLVIGEVAIAVMLLAGAALLLKSFDRMSGVSPGADIERVLTGRIALPGARYDTPAKRAEFYKRLTERLSASPEVEAAGATSFVPVGGGGFGLGRVFLAEGWPSPPAGPDVAAQWNVITPDYFRTVGIPIVRGRPFDGRDTAASSPTIIVTSSFARRMFGDADPIGRRTKSWRDENVLREIVGVVADVRYEGLLAEETPLVYVPHTQNSWGGLSVVVRARQAAPPSLAPLLRREIAALDGQLAVARVRTMADSARESIARQRYTTMLVTMLAAAALILGALGIYGVLSYSVSLRRQELGLRIALGASSGDLYRLVLTGGLGLALAGLVIGSAGAFAVSRVLGGLLYEVEPTDPLAYAAAAAAILAAAALACYLPARRAAKSDPLLALKSS